MIPYGFGFEPNEYQDRLDLRVDFKALGRNCRAIVKKATGKANRKK